MATTAPFLRKWLVLSLLVAALLARAVSGDASAACVALGFTGQSLCSDCDLLLDATRDAQLSSECRGCCVEDAAAPSGGYTSAELEADSWSLPAYGEVRDFLDGNKAVKVRYRSGQPPTLVLRKEVGGKKEPPLRVVVAKWKAKAIAEFVAQQLVAAAPAKEYDDDDDEE